MNVFYYDRSFGGLLSALFDAYRERVFPNALLANGDIPPLASVAIHRVATDEAKADRVWAGLARKLTAQGRSRVTTAWLSEEEGADLTLLRFMRKAFDSNRPVETDYADPDVLAVSRLDRKVRGESHLLTGFARFQKTAEGIFFAPVSPRHNCLPLMLSHFADRFAGQPWILYDTKRGYGVFHDQGDFRDITLNEGSLREGELQAHLLAEGETLFQELWRGYCQAVTIRERINPALQARLMPRRFWPLMTEMRPSRGDGGALQ